MSGSHDDFESPYFDWDNDRLFDQETRGLIDRIAHDPRFTRGHEGSAVAEEWSAHLPEDRRSTVLHAAWEVFDSTVGKELSRRAEEIVQKVLSDPDFDALPDWYGADGAAGAPDDHIARLAADPDPRLGKEVTFQLSVSESFRARQERAQKEVEKYATELLQNLPHDVKDRLVLVTRNAQREDLLAEWIGDEASKRRSWIAYYAQRMAKEAEEESVLDRYAAAVKILLGRGWSKKAITRALGIATSRLEKLLERTTGQDLADDDPLCALAPELCGAGSEWRSWRLSPHETRPKPLSRMTVDEKVALAAVTEDQSMHVRLAESGSRRICEALIARFARSGDVSEEVLRAVRDQYPGWMDAELLEAHRTRALPPGLALEMAAIDPRALMYCDDATAAEAAATDPLMFEHVVALRNLDIDGLIRILASDKSSRQWEDLVDLLAEHPLDPVLRDSYRFIDALLEAAASAPTDERSATGSATIEDLSATLLLIAGQNDAAFDRLIQTNETTGSLRVSPNAIAAAALGPYHLGGRGRTGLLDVAQRLWASTDLTLEHALARSVVTERGDEVAVIETDNDAYVASGDGIRCFNKSGSPTYTYVHLHLTAAVERHLQGGLLRMPTSLPALPYDREMVINPLSPDAGRQQAIVWPIPFEPAIYSLDVSLGTSVGYFAASGGRTAVVEDLGSSAPSQAAVTISLEGPQTRAVYMTVREAVRAACELQVHEGDPYGVGLEFTVPGNSDSSFLQWALADEGPAPIRLYVLEASIPETTPGVGAVLKAHGYSRSTELEGIWVADTTAMRWATDDDLVDFLESQVRLLGADDGQPFSLYP